jgi:hypothetical protein
VVPGHGYSDGSPVAPVIVAVWLTERAAARSNSATINVALPAIKFGHRIAGKRFDSVDPDLQRALAGARRAAVREQHQAAPHRPAVLGDVLATLADSDIDRRDATLYAGAARIEGDRDRLREAWRWSSCAADD